MRHELTCRLARRSGSGIRTLAPRFGSERLIQHTIHYGLPSVPNVINLHTAAAPLPIVADISHLRGGEPAGLLALLQDELVAVFGLLE